MRPAISTVVMSAERPVRRALLLLVCLTVLVGGRAKSLYAQGTSATINGQITDSQGRSVPAVDVQAVNIDTNVVYRGKTNDSGIYVIPSVPPGQYRLVVRRDGFKEINKTGLVLHVQDTLQQNFALEVGSISESVTVEAGGLVINTTDASVSTVVDQAYIRNMPLNGRSFQDLILLTPGVVTQPSQVASSGSFFTGLGLTGEFSVNGQRTESNYYTVDGVSANVGSAAGSNMIAGGGPSGSLAASTALGTTQALVSVDALQEFRVQSSTYSAEYGRSPGGQFAFETKSGTNQWHGTAFDYLRNGYFDANDWFNDYYRVKYSALHQNDFGGTLGGPVKIPGLYNGKDKTFFFVSYEGLRLVAPQAATVNYVPDLCMRGTGACPTSGPGAGRKPAAAALLPVMNAFPVPNGPDDATNGFAQFIGSWSNPASLDSTSVRFDHVVSDKLRLFFRFSDTGSSSASRGTYRLSITPSMNTKSAYTLRTYTAGFSSLVSSRLSNEFRLNYSSNAATNRTVIDAFGGSTPVNLVQLTGLSSGSNPSVFPCYDVYCFGLSQSQQSGAQRQWNFVDTATLSLGRHQLKFGVDYRRLAPFDTPPSAMVPFYYGFVSGGESDIETNSAFTDVIVQAPAYPLFTNFSAFAQDQWKVTARLSLSLGLRWDVNPSPGVTKGLMPYTLQGLNDPNTVTLAPQGTPLWRTTWYNLAPRLGAAYIVHNAAGWETVVRGGGGIFFDTGQQLTAGGFAADGFVADGGFVPASFPGPVTIPVIVNPPQPQFFLPVGIYPHLQLPYALEWNASLEQALGPPQTVTISYVGSHAARLLQKNYFQPVNNPNLANGAYYLIENGSTADYDSLQAQFRRRLGRGLAALASYTGSHCIDYGSQNYLFGYRRGNCDYDVRHNASLAFSYDLPGLGRSRFARAVLGHWGVDDRFSARTAFPVPLNGRQLIQPNGQTYYAGLNLVAGQPIYIYGAQCAAVYAALFQSTLSCPGGRAINPNAFTRATSGIGDAPRNFARGFGAWQMDLAVRRDFPIYEGLKLQFRAEAFNIFNHPNFGRINGSFRQSTFGQATSTLANSLGVLNPLYQMGGPRSAQFALKLVF